MEKEGWGEQDEVDDSCAVMCFWNGEDNGQCRNEWSRSFPSSLLAPRRNAIVLLPLSGTSLSHLSSFPPSFPPSFPSCPPGSERLLPILGIGSSSSTARDGYYRRFTASTRPSARAAGACLAGGGKREGGRK